MRLIVPIGTQSEVKARTRLSELRAMYKEDVTIDYQSGEVTINGQPNFSYAKQYIFPSKDGTQIDVNSFAPEGYDLSGTMALDYFWKRFIIETKVPKDRFSTTGAEGATESNWTSGGESITREEIRFSYFINRIRSILQEILLKPTWIQFCLKHPEFAKDKALKGAVGLEFVEENLFSEAKKRDIARQGAGIVNELMGVKQYEVNSEGEITTDGMYFDPKFLVEKYMNFTEEDLKLNDKYKTQRKSQLTRISETIKRLNKIKGEEEGEAGGMGGGELGSMGSDLGTMGGGIGELGGGPVPGEEGGTEEGGAEEAGGATELGI